MGTFLVRSGILTSVHAFAVDPRRGVFILTIMIVLIGGALALYAWRAPQLQQGGLFAPISREGALVLNNVLLTTACATVFVGTLYPLALESLTGAKISVGPPYFNLTFGPLMLPLLAAMPFGPYLAWKRGDLAGAAQRLFAAALAGSRRARRRLRHLLARALAGAVRHRARRVDRRRRRLRVGLAREAVRGRRRRDLAPRPRPAALRLRLHAGARRHRPHACSASSPPRPGRASASSPCARAKRTEIAGYELTFRGVAPAQGPNYQEQVGLFTVTRGGSAVTELSPAKRLYDAPRQPTTEAAIHVALAGDLYVVLGDELKDGSGWVVRLYFNPLVRLIWIGAIVMALGGALSLCDRRLRIGAPRRARRRAPPPRPRSDAECRLRRAPRDLPSP